MGISIGRKKFVKHEFVPKCNTAVILAGTQDQPAHAMSIGDVLEDAQMEIPLLLFAPIGTIGSVNEVASDIVFSKGFGKGECRLLVLSDWDNADGRILLEMGFKIRRAALDA